VKAMAEDETYKILQKFAQELGSLKQQLKEVKGEGRLPWYLAKSPDEMEQELFKQGRFVQPEAGLQDDIQNTCRFFVKTNEKGDLLPSFESKYMPNASATFMEMCETLTLSNVLWQFTPLGYLSALKGGWNVAIADAKNKAEKRIRKVKVGVGAISEANDVASYFSSQKKLAETLNEDKKYRWILDRTNNVYKLEEVVLPTPIPTKSYHLIGNTSTGPKKKKVTIPINEEMVILGQYD
jgi:hypothetical protein